jgi:tRNA (mo5U34)-methyltransferase
MSNETRNLNAESITVEEIRQCVQELGSWFHNIDLKGVQTAPDHFLGDYPALKWRRFAHAIPYDLSGKSVLDIGCNAGFYSLEMKKRGADRVLGIDFDDQYLAQAKFAARVSGLDIEFRRLSVYEIAQLQEKFDIVIFMGVFYHLRHPLLALDLLHEYVVKDLFIFQSMLRGSDQVEPIVENYSFWEKEIFDRPGFPQMYFIESRYSQDPTNWWIPNRACVEALLRSSGFDILDHPEEEVYMCRWRDLKGEVNLPEPMALIS